MTTTEEEVERQAKEAPIQAALPGMELPEHHGRAPVTQTTKLNGSGQRFLGEHEVGQRVIFVVEARTKASGPFTENADGALDFAETHTITDLFQVPGAAGPRIISAMRQAYRIGDEELEGRERIEGAEFTTDGSGVVMTAEEVAEIRGDPLAAAFDPRLRPVVVVYSDGARELWPEEFGANEPMPIAGDHYAADDGSTTFVEKLLDAVTGETVAEWSPEQENERLEELEKRLEAEEADDG